MPERGKSGRRERTARLCVVLSLLGTLSCAWNSELSRSRRIGAEGELVAHTRGEHFGKMTPETQERFKAEIRVFWQAPYLWGGNAAAGVDCSGLVGQIYRNAAAIELPRTVAELFSTGMPVENQPLQFADLVFFRLSSDRQIDHVGLYVARGYFIHASVRQGVSLSLITGKPFRESYAGARRFFQ